MIFQSENLFVRKTQLDSITTVDISCSSSIRASEKIASPPITVTRGDLEWDRRSRVPILNTTRCWIRLRGVVVEEDDEGSFRD